MDISPKTLREVEFREKFRGYHPEDVDAFLERAAVGVEALQNQLRQASERVAQAEQLASASGTTDEAISRTLLLAQRTADMAVEEAREQAARLVAAAESQAKNIVEEASQRAARTTEEALAELRTQLADLHRVREQLQQDVDVLQQWVEQHRSSLSMSLGNLLRQLEADLVVQSAPPALSDVELPGRSEGTGGTGAIADDDELIAFEDDDDDADADDADGAGVDDAVEFEDAELDDPELVDAYDEADYADEDEVNEVEEGDDDLVGVAGDAAGVAAIAGDQSALPEDSGLGGREGTQADEPVETNHAGADGPGGEDEHDPFMAELRRAVTDTEPLGPREDDSEPAAELPHASLQEDLDARRFGSRRRRRR